MNFLKLMSNLGNMAKIQAEIKTATEEAAKVEYSGEAGGGLVTAVATGNQQLLRVSIDPKLLKADDRDLVEALVVAASNDALNKAKKGTADALAKVMAEKFDMPDVANLLSGFLPK